MSNHLPRLPYVCHYRDRHGKRRAYYRRGEVRSPLPVDQGEKVFVDAYERIRELDVAGKLNKRQPVRDLRAERFAECVDRLLFAVAKRSITKKRDNKITRQWIAATLKKQKYRCCLTGLDFSPDRYEGGSRNPFAPSIDRIDSALGYTPENCRIVLASVNIALNEWGEQHFETICRAYLARRSPAIG